MVYGADYFERGRPYGDRGVWQAEADFPAHVSRTAQRHPLAQHRTGGPASIGSSSSLTKRFSASDSTAGRGKYSPIWNRTRTSSVSTVRCNGPLPRAVNASRGCAWSVPGCPNTAWCWVRSELRSRARKKRLSCNCLAAWT